MPYSLLRIFSTAAKHTSIFSLLRKARQPKCSHFFEHFNVHLLGILRCIRFSRPSAHICHGICPCSRWMLGYGISPFIALSRRALQGFNFRVAKPVIMLICQHWPLTTLCSTGLAGHQKNSKRPPDVFLLAPIATVANRNTLNLVGISKSS
jgi:hypothetical protein